MYIKSLNLVLKDITSKMNSVADILLGAMYFHEEEMLAHGESEDLIYGGYMFVTNTKMWLMKYCHSKMSFMKGD